MGTNVQLTKHVYGICHWKILYFNYQKDLYNSSHHRLFSRGGPSSNTQTWFTSPWME